MTTLELKQSVLQEIASLSTAKAMKKLRQYVRTLKEEEAAEKQIKRKEAYKKELKEDLREALHELKLAQEGKIKLMSLDELIDELENDR